MQRFDKGGLTLVLSPPPPPRILRPTRAPPSHNATTLPRGGVTHRAVVVPLWHRIHGESPLSPRWKRSHGGVTHRAVCVPHRAFLATVTCSYRVRFRVGREPFKTFQGLLPERQGQNLALTLSYVPYSLDSGERVETHTPHGTHSRKPGAVSAAVGRPMFLVLTLQVCLAHKKTPPCMALQ